MIEFDNVLSAFGGAALAIVVGIVVEAWKTERADFFEDCHDFIELISEAADGTAEFWLSSAKDERAPFLSARVRGFHTRISAFNAIIELRFEQESASEVADALASYFIAMSGGDPDDPDRKPSMERAVAVHDAAGTSIVAIRRAAYGRASWRESAFRWVSRRWPNRRSR